MNIVRVISVLPLVSLQEMWKHPLFPFETSHVSPLQIILMLLTLPLCPMGLTLHLLHIATIHTTLLSCKQQLLTSFSSSRSGMASFAPLAVSKSCLLCSFMHLWKNWSPSVPLLPIHLRILLLISRKPLHLLNDVNDNNGSRSSWKARRGLLSRIGSFGTFLSKKWPCLWLRRKRREGLRRRMPKRPIPLEVKTVLSAARIRLQCC